MSDDAAPTIFGWTPTGSVIIAGGAVIAIVVGSLSMLMTASIPPFGGWLFLAVIALLLVSTVARLVLRPHAPRPTGVIFFGVAIKLANMVAVILLGFTALAAFATDNQYWRNLVGAFLFDLVLGATISLLTAIVANLTSLSANRPPPSTPPA